MKSSVLTSALLFAFVLAIPTHADAGSIIPKASRPCPLMLPEQTSTGTLMNGQTSTVIQWSLTCTGLFTASATGGRLILQSANGNGWDAMRRGSSIAIPKLGPGKYRLIVENVGRMRVNFRVRHRYGFG